MIVKKETAKKRILFWGVLIVLILFIVPFFVLVINTFKSTKEFIDAPLHCLRRSILKTSGLPSAG